MERRSFLIGAAGIAAGVAGTKLLEQTTNPLTSQASTANDGVDNNILYSVGPDGQRHKDVVLGNIPSAQMLSGEYRSEHSVLTELNTSTGLVRQTALPMAKAHSVVQLPNGNLLVVAHHASDSLILDREHNVVQRLIAQDDQLFGGHGMLLPGTDFVLLPTRHANPKSAEDNGYIYVYRSDTFSMQRRINSGGVHPHELRILPGEKEMVVTHYGDVGGDHKNGLVFNITEPKLSVFNIKDLSIQREYIQPVDAIFTHMDIGKDGHVYAVTNQYIPMDLNQRAINRLLQQYNIGHEHNLSQASKLEKRIAIPGPVIKIDPLTGDREELVVSPELHLRSQSVAAHHASGKVFATYAFSNQLIVHDEYKDSTHAVDAYTYGIRNLRGVVSIPSSDCIAISDNERGVVIVNAHTLESVATLDAQLFSAPHIFV